MYLKVIVAEKMQQKFVTDKIDIQADTENDTQGLNIIPLTFRA